MSGALPSVADDRACFERMYRETRTAVLAYIVRRTESPEDAADLLGEVYLIAWRRISDLPPGEQARLWLFGVARRVLANQHRRYRSQGRLAAALEEALASATRVDAASGGEAELSAEVVVALRELSSSDQELLMLNAWEGLTPAQIAVVLSRPAALIRVRLHRARTRLRARLLEESKEDLLHARMRPREASLAE